MKKLAVSIGVLVIAIVAGIVLLIVPGNSQAPTTNIDPHADLIVVDSPKTASIVSSPLVVSGKARGTWYFEASFPVELLDAQGTAIAQTPAKAQGDWMTTEFVPFTVTLSFAKQPVGSHGTLILKKDNPSGDPAHEDSLSIPILF